MFSIHKFTLVLLAMVALTHLAQSETTNIVGRVVPYSLPYMRVLSANILDLTSKKLNVSVTAGTNDIGALQSGEIDFIVTDQPITQSGDILMQFPIATTGISIISNLDTEDSHTLSLHAKDLAGILKGEIRQWKDSTLTKYNPHLKETKPAAQNIRVVIWDESGPTITEIKRFMEYNSKGAWPSNTKIAPPNRIDVSSYEEAIEKVKSTPGSMTYAPYGTTPSQFFPAQFFVEQSGDFVPPSPAGFTNSLMPLKQTSDVPKADQSWKSFSLTDMRKMPPDGSCMAMPPYPLSRFLYVVMKKDQTGRGKSGTAAAAFVELSASADLQALANGFHLAGIVAPVAESNSAGIKQILFAQGLSVDEFIASVPITAIAPLNMDDGMLMKPASTQAVAIMITILLLSGILSVAGYYAFLKFVKKENPNTSWVPFKFGKKQGFEPLPLTEMR